MRKPITNQRGQSVVEYTVIMAFVFVGLLAGDDMFNALMDVVKDNYRGYSYAVSMAQIPDYDSLYEYGMTTSEAQQFNSDISGLLDTFDTITGQGFPNVDDFATIVGDQIPDSPADILDGALSFF